MKTMYMLDDFRNKIFAIQYDESREYWKFMEELQDNGFIWSAGQQPMGFVPELNWFVTVNLYSNRMWQFSPENTTELAKRITAKEFYESKIQPLSDDQCDSFALLI